MLRHKKQPTPQELYWARKRRDDEERDANLPPGLVNHGNTCFMNSTLQGLIATPLLHSLVNFEDVPNTSPAIAAYRSPQLTNGHGHGGQYDHEWVQGMPLGDVFVSVLQKAWRIQHSHKRETMSPKELLTTIGQKYDQYLDFRQQDAHEFLRHMLDAMRMEELDIIKKRQPPPPRQKRRQLRRQVQDSGSEAPDRPPDEDSPRSNGRSNTVLDDQKLLPFVDMLFGGKLASILVCTTCNKISVTYEDFNDLSLSIKPEDYIKERKRDRFKSLAKKLRFRPKELSQTNGVRAQRSSSVPASPVRRSMEPPADETEPPVNVDHRRRSFDNATADVAEEERDAAHVVAESAEAANTNEVAPVEQVVKVTEEVQEKTIVENDTRQAGHVSFAESSRSKVSDAEKKTEGWGKLGRRISMSMGMSKKDKRQSRSYERGLRAGHSHDSGDSRAPSEERLPTSTSTPRIGLTDPMPINPDAAHLSDVNRSRGVSPAPAPPSTPSPALSPALGIVGAFPNIRRSSTMSFSDKRPKEPRIVKPSREESAYLRRILADVHPSSHSTFSMLHQALSGATSSTSTAQSSPALSAQALLAKLSHLPGIEECLRLFTAVEVMDGENMVGCHRCWKIANGTYKPRHRSADDEGSGEESEEDSQESAVLVNPEDVPRSPIRRRETVESAGDLRGYMSAASETAISPRATSSSLFLHETASISSAPTTFQSAPSLKRAVPTPLATEVIPSATPPAVLTPEAPVSSYGGLPIPVISTTAPDTPTPAPDPSETPVVTSDNTAPALSQKDTLLPPSKTKRKMTRRNADPYDSSVSSDDEGYDSASDASADGSVYSDASSLASASASPSASPRASAERLPLSGHASLASGDSGRPSSEKKVPRAERVLLRRTYKRYLIATPPPILVIHLKRFQQISKSNPYAMAFSGGFKKLDDFVAFPEYLDLAPYLAPRKEDFGLRKKKSAGKNGKKESECMYRLYAVVVHIGNMLGGHYIAYTALPLPTASSQSSTNTASSSSASEPHAPESSSNSKQPRQWAYISDTVVRLTTLEEVLKAKAYICMYERIY